MVVIWLAAMAVLYACCKCCCCGQHFLVVGHVLVFLVELPPWLVVLQELVRCAAAN